MSARPKFDDALELGLMAGSSDGTACACRCEFLSLLPGGTLLVRNRAGEEIACDWLESSSSDTIELSPSDELLILRLGAGERAVVLGRIGRYARPQPRAHVTLQATESLTLQCGEASVNLRADGKVMVKGEDVLLRAKGTQRIRAGTVAIN